MKIKTVFQFNRHEDGDKIEIVLEGSARVLMMIHNDIDKLLREEYNYHAL